MELNQKETRLRDAAKEKQFEEIETLERHIVDLKETILRLEEEIKKLRSLLGPAKNINVYPKGPPPKPKDKHQALLIEKLTRERIEKLQLEFDYLNSKGVLRFKAYDAVVHSKDCNCWYCETHGMVKRYEQHYDTEKKKDWYIDKAHMFWMWDLPNCVGKDMISFTTKKKTKSVVVKKYKFVKNMQTVCPVGHI